MNHYMISKCAKKEKMCNSPTDIVFRLRTNLRSNPIVPIQVQGTSCPRDAFKLGEYASLLNGTAGVVMGNPRTIPCCSLLAGLVNVDVTHCLFTALKANVIGINLNTCRRNITT